jgi:hypothetical protein
MAACSFTKLLDSELEQILSVYALQGSRKEPPEVEFKLDFDGSNASWLDVLKHLLAMANSGGGTLVFGVDRDGNRRGLATSLLVTFDPANVTNKLRKYCPASITTAYRELPLGEQRFGFLLVDPCNSIGVFESDGTFQSPEGKPGRCFVRGVVYVRVPGSTREANQRDLDDLVHRISERHMSAFLARIERIAKVPAEAELIATNGQDQTRGVVITKRNNPAVIIRPEAEATTAGPDSLPISVTVRPDDPEAIPVTEIPDVSVPFQSLNSEVISQTRHWVQTDKSHRVSRRALCRWYLGRSQINLSPEAAELCFLSAGYGRGFPMFWAECMAREALRHRLALELETAKSPMRELLPFVVGAFFWEDRDSMLAATHSAMRKLKVRHIASQVKAFASQNVFAKSARKSATKFSLASREWSLNQLFSDRGASQSVFDALVQLELESRLDEKLRSVAYRLDLWLHTAL